MRNNKVCKPKKNMRVVATFGAKSTNNVALRRKRKPRLPAVSVPAKLRNRPGQSPSLPCHVHRIRRQSHCTPLRVHTLRLLPRHQHTSPGIFRHVQVPMIVLGLLLVVCPRWLEPDLLLVVNVRVSAAANGESVTQPLKPAAVAL
jgi:hypothetical protein